MFGFNRGDELDDATREKIAIVATDFVFLCLGIRRKVKGERDDEDHVRHETRLKIDRFAYDVRCLPEFLEFTGSNGSYSILSFAALHQVSDKRRWLFVRPTVKPIHGSIR